jgi:hypothetical protein
MKSVCVRPKISAWNSLFDAVSLCGLYIDVVKSLDYARVASKCRTVA